jgi:quercetin 2,3-dioxygenase
MNSALYAGSDRFLTSVPGRITRHSFSFGEHYDPANLGFGPMICHNDDALSPGSGYPDHPHTDLEIVTWVIDGVLLHTDDAGNTEELLPGDVQVMSAGAGIRHAEMADAHSGPTRFLQTWIRPDEVGTAPRWRSEHVDPGSGLTTVVGGDGLSIGTRGASLSIARLKPGANTKLPDVARVHAFVAVGAGRFNDVDAQAGDAVRLTDQPGAAFEATADTELLVWSFTR